jgi:hypothetical protein
MNTVRHLFLFLVIATMAMSAFQFNLIENENCISLIEEERETVTSSEEMQEASFQFNRFQLFTVHSYESFDEKFTVVHFNLDYPEILLDVPYSPPEFI